MERSTLSVVIPAHNAAAFLGETLQSVHSQSRRPDEIIVVDDGSTDDTAQVAERGGAEVLRLEGKGAAAALNAGIRRAQGDWIAHFDADDLMLPDKLARQAELLESDTSGRLGLVASNLTMFDGLGCDQMTFLDGRPHFQAAALHGSALLRLDPDGSAALLSREHCVDVKGVYRRSAWQAVGGFDPAFRCAYDMDFVWRVSRQFEIAVITDVLFLGRRHARNLSGDSDLVSRECARLFRSMRSACSDRDARAQLGRRLRRELRDLAYDYRHRGRWFRSLALYLAALAT